MDNLEMAQKIQTSVAQLPAFLCEKNVAGVHEVSDFILSEPRVFAVSLVGISLGMAESWKIPVADGFMLAPSAGLEEGPAKQAARLLTTALNGDSAELEDHVFGLVNHLAKSPDITDLRNLWLAVLDLWFFLLSLPLVAIPTDPV